ncbi:hypothetical protein P4K48_32695 [Bacillus anthracis]|nr:transposase [Bacillus thuringiensis]MEB9674014.1 hypothetical protein [Bacillus anthracis]
MPRFKNIGSQKLYRPETGMNEAYPQLQDVLSRPSYLNTMLTQSAITFDYFLYFSTFVTPLFNNAFS